jgi:hypothetical protein
VNRLDTSPREATGKIFNGCERARTFIAKIERNMGDWLAGTQPRQRLEQADVLPPLDEAHPGFLAEQSCQRAPAEIAIARPVIQVLVVAGIAHDCRANAHQPSV